MGGGLEGRLSLEQMILMGNFLSLILCGISILLKLVFDLMFGIFLLVFLI
jgi:hypothetical protein